MEPTCVLKKKKEFSGRKRIWAEGELEKSYPKQSEEFLTLAFGEPDDYEGGAMIYNNIVVKDRNCSVSFTLKFGLIESVEITPVGLRFIRGCFLPVDRFWDIDCGPWCVSEFFYLFVC